MEMSCLLVTFEKIFRKIVTTLIEPTVYRPAAAMNVRRRKESVEPFGCNVESTSAR
jgi:hypothetical protein